MILASKLQMTYKNYSWTNFEEGDPRISGNLDSTTFNRNEGNEMLYIIQKLIEIWKLEDRKSVRKLEKMIFKFLPDEIVKQEDVKNWVRNHWDYY